MLARAQRNKSLVYARLWVSVFLNAQKVNTVRSHTNTISTITHEIYLPLLSLSSSALEMKFSTNEMISSARR